MRETNVEKYIPVYVAEGQTILEDNWKKAHLKTNTKSWSHR